MHPPFRVEKQALYRFSRVNRGRKTAGSGGKTDTSRKPLRIAENPDFVKVL
jgi:hypothetical protein